MRRYWTVSSCRGRRGTSLFSWKIHRYFFLSVYLDGFLRANANRRWLISKKSSECKWTRRDLVIYLSLLFCHIFESLIYSKLFFRDYEVSLHRWMLDEYCNTFPLSEKDFRVVEQTKLQLQFYLFFQSIYLNKIYIKENIHKR